MSVLPQLTERALRRALKPFRLGELIAARGVNAQTVNRFYDLSTTRGRYILRILENRTCTDARFEESLLEHLMRRGLSVPKMIGAGRKGCVVPLEPGRLVSVFAYMPGREVAVFEVSTGHANQVGRFLADLHRAGRGLGRRRRDRYDTKHLHSLLTRCTKAAQSAEHAQDIASLQTALKTFTWPQGLPQGTIHGDLCIDHVRFERGALCGVLDFACAAKSALLYDVALALVDWAFVRDKFCPERACALVVGYAQRRSLLAEERAALYALCCIAAVRYAVYRLCVFELSQGKDRLGPYRDYRHFMVRLQQLDEMGQKRFEAALWCA